MAEDGQAMRRCLRALLHEPDLARALAASGLRTILARHTCGHRVDQLLAIVASLGRGDAAGADAAAAPPRSKERPG